MAYNKTPTRAMTRTPRRTGGDRYIPNRAATDMNYARFKSCTTTPNNTDNRLLDLHGQSAGNSALQFSTPTKKLSKCKYFIIYSQCIIIEGRFFSDWDTPKRPSARKIAVRKIPKTADRVLDAPNILNDFCK